MASAWPYITKNVAPFSWPLVVFRHQFRTQAAAGLGEIADIRQSLAAKAVSFERLDVEVERRPGDAVQDGGDPANHEVPNLVPLERLEHVLQSVEHVRTPPSSDWL